VSRVLTCGYTIAMIPDDHSYLFYALSDGRVLVSDYFYTAKEANAHRTDAAEYVVAIDPSGVRPLNKEETESISANRRAR